MFRHLTALEIAEGALLADMAVVFQLIVVVLPFGSSLFRLLIFIVFAILVLRRGLYVGIMGVCVALFLISVMIGPQYCTLMVLEGMGGLFLGFTMKRRVPHLLLLLLGVVGGALAFFALLFIVSLLTGFPLIANFTRSLHQFSAFALPLLNTTAVALGLGGFWRQTLSPAITTFMAFLFTYTWLALYLALCVILTPVVTALYVATNLFVRLLGYDVRPIPDGWLGRLVQRLWRRLFRRAIKWGLVRKLWSSA